jgi:hypothetical protein
VCVCVCARARACPFSKAAADSDGKADRDACVSLDSRASVSPEISTSLVASERGEASRSEASHLCDTDRLAVQKSRIPGA